MIVQGDRVLVYAKEAIVVTKEYTKMVYDSYDYDLDSWGYEGGTAVGYIDVKYDNETVASVPIRIVKKLG